MLLSFYLEKPKFNETIVRDKQWNKEKWINENEGYE